MFMGFFEEMLGLNALWDSIKEGPVEIRFDLSEDDRVKVTYRIDFGKTDLSPAKASDLCTVITNILRKGLGVRLSKLV